MKTRIKIALAMLAAAWRRFRCKHQTATPNGREIINHVRVGSPLAISDWGEPEPHPVPKFAATVKIQRQRTAHVCHCGKCGKTWIVFGHNQKDVSEQGADVVTKISAEVFQNAPRNA